MRLLGHIMAETDTRTETTGEALRVITDEFFRLQRIPRGGRELEDAKAYLAGNFPLTIETPDAISTRDPHGALLRPAARRTSAPCPIG